MEDDANKYKEIRNAVLNVVPDIDPYLVPWYYQRHYHFHGHGQLRPQQFHHELQIQAIT
jgi:hypothetical protein